MPELNPQEAPEPTAPVEDKFGGDYEALMASYKSLEKQHTQQSQGVAEVAVPPEAPPAAEETPSNTFSQYEDQYITSGGQMDDSFYEDVSKNTGMEKDQIEDFIKFREDQAKTRIFSAIGGEDNFNHIREYIGAKGTPDEIAAFDAVLTSRDEQQITQELMKQMIRLQTIGGGVTNPPNLVQGGANASSDQDVFRDQAAVNRAYTDPQFVPGSDYAASLIAKIKRSVAAGTIS